MRHWPPPTRPVAPACASFRADSQFYNAGVIAACRRASAHFSITTGMNPSVKRAIAAVPDTAWQQITYPTAVPDPEAGELMCWIRRSARRSR